MAKIYAKNPGRTQLWFNLIKLIKTEFELGCQGHPVTRGGKFNLKNRQRLTTEMICHCSSSVTLLFSNPPMYGDNLQLGGWWFDPVSVCEACVRRVRSNSVSPRRAVILGRMAC